MKLLLYNLGNTCYINTAFQCLMSTREVETMISSFPQGTSELLDKIHAFRLKCMIVCSQLDKQYLELENKHNRGQAELLEKNKDVYQLWREILQYLQSKMKSRIDLFEENDLSEFVMLLIETMLDECKEELSKTSTIQLRDTMSKPFVDHHKPSVSNRLGTVCAHKWTKTFSTMYSKWVPTFNSWMISQIKCKCGKLHHNHEVHTNIQLDIGKHQHVTHCIKEFARPVYFNTPDGIEWKCDGCNQTQIAKKVSTFWRTADVLIVFLKRFVMTNTGSYVKLNKRIQFDTQLDMTPYHFHSKLNSKYTLQSVGCHIGNMQSGHYFSLVRKNSDWYTIDDDNETPTSSFQSLAETHGYMFVYSRNG